MAIRILLADDHVLVRQGVRVLLEQAGMVVIGEAADGLKALQLAHTHAPAVALLDIAMPHLNGLETARRLRETVPQTKTILLTMHTDEPYVLAALQAGAVGYVVKTQATADLVQAIHTVVQGAVYLSPWVTPSATCGHAAGRRIFACSLPLALHTDDAVGYVIPGCVGFFPAGASREPWVSSRGRGRPCRLATAYGSLWSCSSCAGAPAPSLWTNQALHEEGSARRYATHRDYLR